MLFCMNANHSAYEECTQPWSYSCGELCVRDSCVYMTVGGGCVYDDVAAATKNLNFVFRTMAQSRRNKKRNVERGNGSLY